MAERILAVDDNPVNLKVVRATLIRAGYDVFTASNGLEALAILEEMVPDIILLDITMPDMDGYEVCRRLRAKPETAHVPVMMLTAHDSLDEKVKGFEAGADDRHLQNVGRRHDAFLLEDNAQEASHVLGVELGQIHFRRWRVIQVHLSDSPRGLIDFHGIPEVEVGF